MLIPVLFLLFQALWLGEAGVAVLKNAKFIIGGTDIDITEAPYQVSIYRKGHFGCAGALIAKDIVLTAATCITDRDNYYQPPGENATFFKVRVGSSQVGEGGEYHHVSKFAVHPRMAEEEYERIPNNDIAILWLSKPVTFSDKIAAVPMKDKNEEIEEGEVTQVTSWGFSGDEFTLQKIMVQTVNATKCKRQVGQRITPQMMCAGTPRGDKGFCYKDLGAPLVHNGKLAGLASYFEKYRCVSRGFPSQVYAKVSAMRSWIDEAIQNNKSN
ncbi:hypothetical protein ABMA28_010118 [Loxostege sticticalis]|uniref:Peptidase S1 domain-containing protein n=1 Tax=Loxostege sticticalis TaxID=481309 RepID=A0ABD0S9T2_LOXSC